MMDNSFVAASANIENLDPEAEGMPIVRAVEEDVQLNCVMSNSFGFGGTNASLAFKRFEGYQGRARGKPGWVDGGQDRPDHGGGHRPLPPWGHRARHDPAG